MADFIGLAPVPQPRSVAAATPEALHYKGFKTAWKQRESSRVVALAFAPVLPNRLAVVTGTRVGVWEAGAGGAAENTSNFSKFKSPTRCVAWRPDGRLVLAGEEAGTCEVIEAENKNVLRRLRGHGDAVSCCSFAASDGSKAATGADDGKLRVWDIATSDLVCTVAAHTDRMRFLAPGPGGPNVWITAGYDGKVHMWDLRIGGSDPSEGSTAVASVDHGSAVESGAVFPGGALFASGGGTEVKLWDLAAGASQPVNTIAGVSSKVVTTVCLDASATTLLTGSYDGYVKVFNAASLEHQFSYKMAAPVTCAAWRPDGRAFAVGLDDGQWQMRLLRHTADGKAATVEDGAVDPKQMKRTKASATGIYRGVHAAPASDDEVIEGELPAFKKKQGDLDYFLRKFEYRKVLEFVVQKHFKVAEGLAAMDALVQRGALESTMTEIGEELCLSTLKWLSVVFDKGDSIHMQLFMEVLHTLLDCNKFLQPPSTQEAVKAVFDLESKVATMVKNQETLMETRGMLQAVTTM